MSTFQFPSTYPFQFPNTTLVCFSALSSPCFKEYIVSGVAFYCLWYVYTVRTYVGECLQLVVYWVLPLEQIHKVLVAHIVDLVCTVCMYYSFICVCKVCMYCTVVCDYIHNYVIPTHMYNTLIVDMRIICTYNTCIMYL